MVIGNGGGGKTTLSLALATSTGLPLTEVDQIQFRPNWERTPVEEVRSTLLAIQAEDNWIIDGFGPWDTIEARFDLADKVYFVDHPIWVHFWWACERQIAASQGQTRVGGPEGCDLRDVTKLMFETLWRVHEEIRPKLVELAEKYQEKTVWIESPEELDKVLEGIGGCGRPAHNK